MSQSLLSASLGWKPHGPPPPRTEAPDPANNIYRTKDGRWLVLCLLYDQWWPDLVRTLDHEEWLDDPRYADAAARAANHVALIAELDGVFATQDAGRVGGGASPPRGGTWSPLKSPDEVIVDAAGARERVRHAGDVPTTAATT